jgi:predicted permease
VSGNVSAIGLEIASIVIPVFSIIGLGLLFARWQKSADIRFVTEFITYIAAPALVFHSLLDEALTYDTFYPILASSFTVAILGIVFGLVAARKLAAGSPAATLTVAFMNSGNMGLPICYFAFGKEGLAAATIFFVAMSIAHYTVGSVIAGGRGKLKEALLLPLTPAAIAAILLNRAQVSLPLVIERPVELLASATIPLMLFSLGVRLSTIKAYDKSTSLTLGAVRFLVGLTTGLGCIYLFRLQGIPAYIVIVQATMPPAIFNFILCEKFGKRPELAASTILAGTILSVITIPLLLYVLFSL